MEHAEKHHKCGKKPTNIPSRCIQVGILTVSDSCYQNAAVDESGKNLEFILSSKKLLNCEVTARECVPDELSKIQEILKEWTDVKKLDLILTTGGTGFSDRDVTPEATKLVIDRESPGISIAMMCGSLKITPMAMLSRAVCGIRKKTIIINLPGSKKGSQECFQQVFMVISHAVDQLQGERELVAQTHLKIQSSVGHLESLHDQEQVEEMHIKNRKSAVEVTKVAHRARESTYPMISVKEAQEIVLNCSHILETKEISYKDALGYILSEDVYAKDDLPPFPASIKDGYAVLASDGTGYRKVIGDNIAGSEVDQFVVTSGTCIRISTGAAVPLTADAVIQVEDTKLIEQSEDGKIELLIEVLKAPKVGQDIRPVGTDIKCGQQLLSKGMTLGSAELGLLAASGIIDVEVYSKPVVSVLSTGNEILNPEETLRPGCVRDSNKTSLMSLLQEQGFTPFDDGVAKDSPDELLRKLEEAFRMADVLISTGGVSMGEKDLLKQILEVDFKAIIHFARVFMKPGKPTTFATLMYNGKKKMVFGLPGNPVSAMVTSHLYVIPCLKKMMGCMKPMPTTIPAKLSFDIKLDPRPEYHRAFLSWKPGESVPDAYSTGYQLSSRLLSMSSANALLILPPYSEIVPAYKKGQIVDALIINRL